MSETVQMPGAARLESLLCGVDADSWLRVNVYPQVASTLAGHAVDVLTLVRALTRAAGQRLEEATSEEGRSAIGLLLDGYVANLPQYVKALTPPGVVRNVALGALRRGLQETRG